MPNQVNNSLGFPAIFRGVLDVRASHITDEMAIAAALELARSAASKRIDHESIVPRMDDWEVFPRVAAATASKAIEQSVAKLSKTRAQLQEAASETIKQARDDTELLLAQGLIASPPKA